MACIVNTPEKSQQTCEPEIQVLRKEEETPVMREVPLDQDVYNEHQKLNDPSIPMAPKKSRVFRPRWKKSPVNDRHLEVRLDEEVHNEHQRLNSPDIPMTPKKAKVGKSGRRNRTSAILYTLRRRVSRCLTVDNSPVSPPVM